jgi:hypothetical protein
VFQAMLRENPLRAYEHIRAHSSWHASIRCAGSKMMRRRSRTVLQTMQQRAARFNVEKIEQQDLARTGGAPDTEG